MANTYIERLIKKYGEDWRGKPYQELFELILKENSINLTKRVGQINKLHWNKALKKISPKEKKFIIPTLQDVLPPESFHFKKATENGKLLSDTLRDNLSNNLRETLKRLTPKTEEQTIIRRRGKGAGEINPALIKEFEKNIEETFKNYTKKDPELGVPGNINQIAVTEINSTINPLKATYMEEVMNSNPDLETFKKWVHHPDRSKEPRKGHGIVADQKPIRFDEPFSVPLYQKVGGRYIRTGLDFMMHPHDPSAPKEQIIGCHCDIQYYTKWK